MVSRSSPMGSSTVIVPYNPNLPHISIKSYLESVTDEVFRRSIESSKIETRCLSPLGQNWKERIVTGVACGVRHLYVDKELGNNMAHLITRNFRKGNYDDCANPVIFKEAIYDDLKSICPDKHLGLFCCHNSIPEYDPARSLRTLETEELSVVQKNYLESLNGNRPDFSKEVEGYIIPETQIGYFKINIFPSPELPETRPIIDKAMKSVVDAEVLIIDLRENNGGSPATVAFVASYLFDQRQLLNQVYQRSNNQLTSFYAEPEKMGQIFGGRKPIIVLTSEETFSAGEELAYDLQSSKRAKIIGQSTAGGAHPVRDFVVDDHILLVVPYAKAINPYTKKNWEKTGVLPDLLIAKEEDALAYALPLIEGDLK